MEDLGELPEHVRRNRHLWDAQAVDYAAGGERAWARDEPTWGVWRVPESELHVLPKDLDGEQTDLTRFEAIIDSMTRAERLNPQLINGSRRSRIARGSGTNVQDVNRLLKQYAQLKKMMKGLKGLEGRMKKGGIPGWRSISG